MWSKIVTPSFGDIDGLRHVNNCMLPVWFELAREPVFRLFHPDLSYDRWQLIMARISVDFLAQMRLGADVEIRTSVRKIGRSSLTVHQEAWQNGEMAARGEAVIVHYDFAGRKSLPIPEDVREKLLEHMAPEGEAPARARPARIAAAGRGQRR